MGAFLGGGEAHARFGHLAIHIAGRPLSSSPSYETRGPRGPRLREGAQRHESRVIRSDWEPRSSDPRARRRAERTAGADGRRGLRQPERLRRLCATNGFETAWASITRTG